MSFIKTNFVCYSAFSLLKMISRAMENIDLFNHSFWLFHLCTGFIKHQSAQSKQAAPRET